MGLLHGQLIKKTKKLNLTVVLDKTKGLLKKLDEALKNINFLEVALRANIEKILIN